MPLSLVPPLVEATLTPVIDWVIREWERATTPADHSSLAVFYTEDALLSQPTGGIRGRDAIRVATGNQGPSTRLPTGILSAVPDPFPEATAEAARDRAAWLG